MLNCSHTSKLDEYMAAWLAGQPERSIYQLAERHKGKLPPPVFSQTVALIHLLESGDSGCLEMLLVLLTGLGLLLAH